MGHTPRCPDVPMVLETILAPLPGNFTAVGAPGGANATGVSCPRTKCLMVAHVEAKPQWVTLQYPGARSVFVACKAGTTRILLSVDVEEVLVPANINVVLWPEDLPSVLPQGRAT